MSTPPRPPPDPEPDARTSSSMFDLRSYMPSPEAYREAADDKAAEELLRRCFDRPEVKEAEEALRQVEEQDRREEERRQVESAAAQRSKKERLALQRARAAPSRALARRPALKYVLLALLATLTPAAVVAYFLSARAPRSVLDPPRAVTASATVSAPEAPSALPDDASAAPAKSAVSATASAPAPRPSGSPLTRTPSTAAHAPTSPPVATSAPTVPATSSALPKVIN